MHAWIWFVGWACCACTVMSGADAAASDWVVVRRDVAGDTLEWRTWSGAIRAVAMPPQHGRIGTIQVIPDGSGVLVPEVDPHGRRRLWRWVMETKRWDVVTVDDSLGLQTALLTPDQRLVGIAALGSGSGAEQTTLFTAEPDGSGLRRLSIDPGGASDPIVWPDGRVIYTRYSQAGSGSLISLFPDGTNAYLVAQAPGTGAWRYARNVPGVDRICAIRTANPTATAGTVMLLDPREGWDPASPRHATVSPDGLFAYPWPIDRDRIVATQVLNGRQRIVILEWSAIRPLWSSADADLIQAVPCRAQPALQRPDLVDWRLTHGWIYVQDLYASGHLGRPTAGSLASVRVHAQRIDPGTGRWGRVAIGETPVEADGSVFVQVPAREALSLEVIDTAGRSVGSMRGTFTVQRGERVSCLGCHTPPHQVPMRGGAAAFRRDPTELRLPAGLPGDPMADLPWARGEQDRLLDLIISRYGNP